MKRLDLLPLVDVMMVVLFALVVSQERELDETQATAADTALSKRSLERQMESMERRLAEAKAADVLELKAEIVQARRDAAKQESARNEMADKLRQMAAQVVKLQQQDYSTPDVMRRDDVLEKLLDQNAVVEVEIGGQAAKGGIENRCCFRAGPRDDAWQSCGLVPAESGERRRWLDGGAQGLLKQLQDTSGGRAVTIVRQDVAATYAVGTQLTATILARLPDHKVYNEGVRLLPVQCGEAK